MRTCPNCGEEWPSTASVCLCGTGLGGADRADPGDRPDRPARSNGEARSGPSTLQVVFSVIVVLALVPSVVILARTLSSGGGAPSAVNVPDNAPEAQPDQLPDRRERPHISCSGPDVDTDCMAWAFTLPGNAFTSYTVHANDSAVAVRTREDVWLLDLATGEERWHRQESAGTTAAVSVWKAGDMVVLETPDGFRALDGDTGEPAAVVTLEGDIIWMIPDDHRMVVVTRGDDVAVQAWDAGTGDLLWTTRIDIPWASAQVDAHGSPGGQMAVTMTRFVNDNSESQHTRLDMSTGRIVDTSDTDGVDLDGLPDTPASWHVNLDGTRLWAGLSPGDVDWERDLDGQYQPPVGITGDHVALYGRDNRFLIVDARTGEDVAHVDLDNSQAREGPPWRPWPAAQGLLLQLVTSDAAHLVRVNMPLD